MTITQNHIAEFLALSVSIISWKSLKKGKLRMLPFFLFFILTIELIGNYFHKVPYANAKLYNFTIPVEYSFYLFVYFQHGQKILKTFSFLSLIVLFTSCCINFYTEPFYSLHDNVLRIGHISVIVCSCIYIYEKFQNPTEESLLQNYFYWLMSGLLLFNLGDFTYFNLFPKIQLSNWDKSDELFESINNRLLLLLYLSYIIAIIVYNKYKSNNKNAAGY
ncbi:hypothetical protein [Ferruginibacter sp.]|nr:hypothetical protein [Ferruginibacter sp.]